MQNGLLLHRYQAIGNAVECLGWWWLGRLHWLWDGVTHIVVLEVWIDQLVWRRHNWRIQAREESCHKEADIGPFFREVVLLNPGVWSFCLLLETADGSVNGSVEAGSLKRPLKAPVKPQAEQRRRHGLARLVASVNVLGKRKVGNGQNVQFLGKALALRCRRSLKHRLLLGEGGALCLKVVVELEVCHFWGTESEVAHGLGRMGSRGRNCFF